MEEEPARSFRVFTILFAVAVVAVASTSAGAIGICYGDQVSKKPAPADVVKLLQANKISMIRLYYSDHDLLNALRDSGIEVIVNVGNPDLEKVASDASAWIQDNVVNFINNVKITYVAVGNEVLVRTPDKVPQLLPAMKAIQDAVNAANLGQSVKVSTPHSFEVVGVSFPPSNGSFRGDIRDTMRSVLDQLAANKAPAMVQMYPYFSYKYNTKDINLDYALLQPTAPTVHDNMSGRDYRNLFDAMYDAFVAALADLGHPDLPILVTESGWPWNGGDFATVQNAQTYVNNLIRHVESSAGSPGRPGNKIPTYIFSLYNEDLKKPTADGLIERYFGLFNTDGSASYPVTFSP